MLCLILLLFGLFGSLMPFASAAPSGLDRPADEYIDHSLFLRFKSMASYAAAPYCSASASSPNDRLMCPEGDCPLAGKAAASTVYEFQYSKGSDLKGFIAVDDLNQLIVLSIRGPSNPVPWLKDSRIMTLPHGPSASGTKVSVKMFDTWKRSHDSIIDNMIKVIKKHPDHRVAITGHGVGGAIATLAAVDLRKQVPKTLLYTFGAPRVGNKAFAKLVEGSGKNYRITNFGDLAVHDPPDKFFSREEFKHHQPEYHILNSPQKARIGLHVEQGSIRVLRDHKDNESIALFEEKPNMWQHMLYFGNITTCLGKPKHVTRDPAKGKYRRLPREIPSEANVDISASGIVNNTKQDIENLDDDQDEMQSSSPTLFTTRPKYSRVQSTQTAPDANAAHRRLLQTFANKYDPVLFNAKSTLHTRDPKKKKRPQAETECVGACGKDSEFRKKLQTLEDAAPFHG